MKHLTRRWKEKDDLEILTGLMSKPLWPNLTLLSVNFDQIKIFPTFGKISLEKDENIFKTGHIFPINSGSVTRLMG